MFSLTYYLVFLMVGVGIALVNLCIMCILCRSRALRQSHNIYVAHLCAADLLVGLAMVFLAVTHLVPSGGLQKNCSFWLCATSFAFTMTSLVASVLCLLIISMERYIKVIWPLRHMSILKPCLLRAMRVACWTMAVTYGVIVFFSAEDNGHGNCRRDEHMFITVALFSVALILLTFLHGAVLRATLRQRQRIRIHAAGHVTEQRRRQAADIRLMLMVALLFGLLYICWLPSLVARMLKLVSDSKSEQLKAAIQVTLVLRYFSTVFNPIIFNTFNAGFRTEVMARVTALCSRNKRRELQRAPKLTVSAIANMSLAGYQQQHQPERQEAELPVQPLKEAV